MINNNYKLLLNHFIEYKKKDELSFMFGGNEDGEYASLTLDEFNTDNMLSLKYYANGKCVFENEYWDEDGESVRLAAELDTADLEMLPDDWLAKMKIFLEGQLLKYNRL